VSFSGFDALFPQMSVSAELVVLKMSYHLTFFPSESVVEFVIHHCQVESQQYAYGDPSPNNAALLPNLIRCLYFLTIYMDHLDKSEGYAAGGHESEFF
jgi:hypothetical protein